MAVYFSCVCVLVESLPGASCAARRDLCCSNNTARTLQAPVLRTPPISGQAELCARLTRAPDMMSIRHRAGHVSQKAPCPRRAPLSVAQRDGTDPIWARHQPTAAWSSASPSVWSVSDTFGASPRSAPGARLARRPNRRPKCSPKPLPPSEQFVAGGGPGSEHSSCPSPRSLRYDSTRYWLPRTTGVGRTQDRAPVPTALKRTQQHRLFGWTWTPPSGPDQPACPAAPGPVGLNTCLT